MCNAPPGARKWLAEVLAECAEMCRDEHRCAAMLGWVRGASDPTDEQREQVDRWLWPSQNGDSSSPATDNPAENKPDSR